MFCGQTNFRILTILLCFSFFSAPIIKIEYKFVFQFPLDVQVCALELEVYSQ